MKRIIKLCLIVILGIHYQGFTQGVAINDNGAGADANAILDVDISSNDKGILIPRLNAAQISAMGAVTTGMLVFNETIGDFQYYGGTAWITIGNTYISTKLQDADADTRIQTESSPDEDKIRFAVAGNEKMILASSGFGIGTSTPTANLDVVGTFKLTDGTQGTNKYLISDANGNASWTGSLISSGSVVLNIRTITASTTALATDNVVICDASSGGLTVSLPPVASCIGRVYTFKKMGSANNVVIDGNGTELIDGSATYTLSAAYKSVRMISRGDRWLVLGGL